MTIKDLVLMSFLGACGGMGVLTTGLFHALIPLPGAGALFFMPLAAACLVIARQKVTYAGAATGTKLIQQLVVFLLPGGPAIAHNPFLIPLLLIEGVLFDLFFRFFRGPLRESPALNGLAIAFSGAIAVLVQVGLFTAIVGSSHFFLAQGVPFFLGVFVGFHSILRFVGGYVGARIVVAIPERPLN
jgi:hypothetical protein